MTELQLLKLLLNKRLRPETFNEIAKIAVILHHEQGLETQSRIVYRILIQYFEDELKNLKSYLHEQAKFLLERGLSKINSSCNLDSYSFEDIIMILNSYHKEKKKYETFWEEMSWLGYSSSGSILKRHLGVVRDRKDPNKLKWIMNSQNAKRNKKTNADKHYSKYHPGARLFLFSFVSMLDRCTTDLKLERIKNSLEPIYDNFTINDINSIRMYLQGFGVVSEELSQKIMILDKVKSKELIDIVTNIFNMNKLLPKCNKNCCRGWHDKSLHIDIDFFEEDLCNESFSSNSTNEYFSDDEEFKLPEFIETNHSNLQFYKRALLTPSPQVTNNTQDILFLWDEMNNSLPFCILYDSFLKSSTNMSHSFFEERTRTLLTKSQLDELIFNFGNLNNLFDQMRRKKRLFEIFEILRKNNVKDIASYFIFIRNNPDSQFINKLISKHGSGIDIFFKVYVEWFKKENRKICRKNRTISCPNLRRIDSDTPESSPGLSPNDSPNISPYRAPSCPPMDFDDFDNFVLF